MGLLSRRKPEPTPVECVHNSLDPRWDAMEDVGNHDRVDHYVCRFCETRLSKEEAERFQ